MRLLLDTHALIWFAAGSAQLPPSVRDLISLLESKVLVSAASAWEIATKFRIGKLPQARRLVEHWHEVLLDLGFVEVPVTADHALRAGLLVLDNADPFDRMIAAQALVEDAYAVSNERAWDAAGVRRVWA